jgi:MFS family permease
LTVSVNGEFERVPAEPSLSRSRVLYAWYVTVLMSLTYLVSLIDRNLLAVALADVKGELHLSDTELGVLYGTGFALLYCVISIPIGQLADRLNRKNLIAAGLAIWTLATIATAFSHTFRSFLFFRVLVGMGEATLVPAGMSLLMNLVPKSQQARATGIFAMGGSQGQTVAFLVGGPLLTMWASAGGVGILGHHFVAWRGLFVLAGIPGLILIPLLLTIREPPRPHAETQVPIRATLRSMQVRWKTYLLHFSSFAAVATVILVLAAWALSVFVRNHGVTAATAGVGLGLISAACMPSGTFLGAWLLDRLTAKGVRGGSPLVIGSSLLLCIPPALIFGFSHSTAWAFVGYGLLLFTVAFSISPGWMGVQTVTPPENRGLAMALFVALYTVIALGLGPVIVGALSDHTFKGPGGLALAVMTSIIAVCVAGAAVAYGGRSAFIAATPGKEA